MIHSTAAKVLSLQATDIEQNQSLVDQGIESQQATEFIQMVHEKTGCKLPLAYVISPDYKLHDTAALQMTTNHTKEKETRQHVLNKSITAIEKNVCEYNKLA